MIAQFPEIVSTRSMVLRRFLDIGSKDWVMVLEENLPWLNEMRRGEQDTKEDAKTTNDHISNSKEWVLPTHCCSS